MKRRILFLCAAALLISAAAVAAPRGYNHNPHKFGPKMSFFNGVGVTFGYVNSSYMTLDLATDETVSSAMLHGFTAGLTKDFALLPGALYFQTGLNYIYQNDSRNEEVDLLVTRLKLVGDREEHYLSVPLRIKYDLDLIPAVGLTFDAGPTLLMGLSSKLKYRTRLSDNDVLSATYNIFTGKPQSSGSSAIFDLGAWMEESGMYPYGKVGWFDVMLGASVGAHFFDVLELRIGYDYGLLNRYMKEVADQYSLHRGQFTLSLGLRF